jgi:hypothetical protein
MAIINNKIYSSLAIEQISQKDFFAKSFYIVATY